MSAGGEAFARLLRAHAAGPDRAELARNSLVRAATIRAGLDPTMQAQRQAAREQEQQQAQEHQHDLVRAAASDHRAQVAAMRRTSQ